MALYIPQAPSSKDACSWGGPCDFLTLNDITQYAFFGNLLLITKYLKCCFMYLCKCVSICRCSHTGELPGESIREHWTLRCWSYRQSWAALCGCWETNSARALHCWAIFSAPALNIFSCVHIDTLSLNEFNCVILRDKKELHDLLILPLETSEMFPDFSFL